MNKKILYIDMDGVITDFEGAIAKLYPKFNNLPLDIRYKKVDSIMSNHRRLFSKLKPIPYAIEYVNLLMDLFDVYFLSTPMWEIPESFMDKRIWLEKYFGDKATKRLILSHRKDLNRGHFLIDDTLRNGADRFKGELIQFGSVEFPDWETVYKYLIGKI